jgi:predicted DNA-binding protein
MKMTRLLIQIPTEMKTKLDALWHRGFTVSGYVRAVLEKELNQDQMKKGA